MKYDSLKTPSDFSKVYKQGKSYADRNLVLYVRPNQLESSRLGLSISKKVGNAVKRNRVRRLIKEVYRATRSFEKHYDFIIIARVRSSEAGYKEINKSMRYLFRKAGIWFFLRKCVFSEIFVYFYDKIVS